MSKAPQNPKVSYAEAAASAVEEHPPPYPGASSSNANANANRQPRGQVGPYRPTYQSHAVPGIPPPHRRVNMGPGSSGVVLVLTENDWFAAGQRARSRFWGALFWALLIYIVIGSLLGSGIEDMARRNHHKHRPDVIGAYSADTNGGDMGFSA